MYTKDQWNDLRDLWLQALDRTNTDAWFRDNVWPVIQQGYYAGTLTRELLQKALAIGTQSQNSSPSQLDDLPPLPPLPGSQPAGAGSSRPDDMLSKLGDAPQPSPGYKSPGERGEDPSTWKIKLDDWSYDPQKVYNKVKSDLFNGDLPDIPVSFGTSTGYADTSFRMQCPENVKSDSDCKAILDTLHITMTDISELEHDTKWHANLLSSIVHEACHVWMISHGFPLEGHGPNFRKLLYSIAQKTGMDYNIMLGDYQPDMQENAMDMRGLIGIVEQLTQRMNEDDEQNDTGAVPQKNNAASTAKDDPLADLRGEDGLITVHTHEFPTGEDIAKRIAAATPVA